MSSTVHNLELDPLGEGAWRLCDRAFAEADPHGVVAYIQVRSDGWHDVTWVGYGVGRRVSASMNDILAEASRLVVAADRPPSRKPNPIPHRPPLRPLD